MRHRPTNRTAVAAAALLAACSADTGEQERSAQSPARLENIPQQDPKEAKNHAQMKK